MFDCSHCSDGVEESGDGNIAVLSQALRLVSMVIGAIGAVSVTNRVSLEIADDEGDMLKGMNYNEKRTTI